VEVGTAGHVWLSHISHIYKDACGLAQAKGLPSLIYHEPAIEVKFLRGAAGTTRILTIRAAMHRSRFSSAMIPYAIPTRKLRDCLKQNSSKKPIRKREPVQNCGLFFALISKDVLKGSIESPDAFIEVLSRSAYRPHLAEPSKQESQVAQR
jgi:hypothetical protein